MDNTMKFYGAGRFFIDVYKYYFTMTFINRHLILGLTQFLRWHRKLYMSPATGMRQPGGIFWTLESCLDNAANQTSAKSAAHLF